MAMVILLMGVSGVGKSAVGVELAAQLGWTFLDADDDHSDAAVARMRHGEPLSDADRRPWIEAVRDRLRKHVERRESVVLACSALRKEYRAALADVDTRFEFVQLEAPPELVRQRLVQRHGHFAGPDLLPSQLLELEPATGAHVVDATASVEAVVATIRKRLDL